MYYELTDHFEVRADIARCWKFFGTAENLPKITPPWLRFRIDNPEPVVIEKDTVLDYTITWCKLPMRWRTKIIDWSPPGQFIDLQLRGPYSLWHHQHTFTPSDQGVICRDRVIYKLPVPMVRAIVHPWIVKPQLLAIFRHRREVIGRELGWVRAIQDDVMIQQI